jgi:ATP-binding cassette subfamily B protein
MKPTKSVFKKNLRVLSFIWRLSPWYLFVYVIRFLCQALLPYVSIYGSAKIIDAIIAGEEASRIMIIVYWMIGLTFFLTAASRALFALCQALNARYAAEVTRKMQDKTHTLSYAQAEDQKTMRLLEMASEGSNGSGGVDNYLAQIGSFISGLSSLILSLWLLSGIFSGGTPKYDDNWGHFLANPYSALIVFGMVILALICSAPMSLLGNKLAYKAMMENVESNRRFSYFYSLCSGTQFGKDIRLFSMQKMIVDLQSKDKYGVNAVWGRFMWYDIAITIGINVLYSLLSFVSYAFLGLKALYGLISVGSAVAYAGAVTLLANGLRDMISSLIQANICSDYLQNYFIYLSLPSSLSFGKERLEEKQPLSIEFRHVTFTYPNQKEPALKDLSISIRPGERLAIVGVNGAGKTTMVKLLCRFYEPEEGEILLDGKPLKSYDEESLDRLSSIVFQDFKLFSFSIADNVASGSEGEEKKIIDSLQKAGIYERVKGFKDGIKTIIYNRNDENGVEISGGEAQKLAIARALYKDSPLVILDEPTSALDPKSEAEVYERFGTLVAQKTSIFISHRMSSTKFCDRIAVISQGQLAEYGSHEELMKIPGGLYKKMWEAQAQYYR